MNFLLVALGGAAGSTLRYAVGLAFAGSTFPYATLMVNVIGCFGIGLAVPSLDRAPLLSPEIRLLVVAGFLGGFTTFSAFALDTRLMWERHDVVPALVYVGASVVLSILGLIAGIFTVRVVLS